MYRRFWNWAQKSNQQLTYLQILTQYHSRISTVLVSFCLRIICLDILSLQISIGLALLNLTAQSISSFTSTGYFGVDTYYPFHGFLSPHEDGELAFNSYESIVLLTSDSMLTVCSVAYFFASPGEYAGMAIQRWLTGTGV